MGTRGTRAYWPTRLMLAFAFVSLPAVLLWLNSMQQGQGMIGPMFTANPWLDWVGVEMAVGAGLWFAGVVWMIRIFRGPSGDPPPWRYRDR